MEDKDKVLLVDELTVLTKNLSLQHGKRISDYVAYSIVKEIVENVYPKLCVKYLTKQQWRV